MEGWIKIYRQIIENEFYFSERFTKQQAWIDLLLLATHKERTVYLKGVEIKLKQGQLCYSQVSLAKRWEWNRKTVKKFLNTLKKRKMVDTRKTNVTTIITIKQWYLYQVDGQQNGQQKDSGFPTNKNVNNDKKELPKEKKKTIKKGGNSFSIENIPLDQNGILFYKNSFFYITQDFRDELISNIPGLTEARLLTEFYKMQTWLEKNKKKKDYQRFIVNWLSKNEYPQSGTIQNDFSFNPVKVYEQN